MNNEFIRCENEHYYNPGKYKSCPYCIRNADEIKARHSSNIVFEAPISASKTGSSIEKQAHKNSAELIKEPVIQEYEATEIISEDDR